MRSNTVKLNIRKLVLLRLLFFRYLLFLNFEMNVVMKNAFSKLKMGRGRGYLPESFLPLAPGVIYIIE